MPVHLLNHARYDVASLRPILIAESIQFSAAAAVQNGELSNN